MRLNLARFPDIRKRDHRVDDIVTGLHGLHAAEPYGAAVRLFAWLGADVEFDWLGVST
jgi:hypothetical protein